MGRWAQLLAMLVLMTGFGSETQAGEIRLGSDLLPVGKVITMENDAATDLRQWIQLRVDFDALQPDHPLIWPKHSAPAKEQLIRGWWMGSSAPLPSSSYNLPGRFNFKVGYQF